MGYPLPPPRAPPPQEPPMIANSEYVQIFGSDTLAQIPHRDRVREANTPRPVASISTGPRSASSTEMHERVYSVQQNVGANVGDSPSRISVRNQQRMPAGQQSDTHSARRSNSVPATVSASANPLPQRPPQQRSRPVTTGVQSYGASDGPLSNPTSVTVVSNPVLTNVGVSWADEPISDTEMIEIVDTTTPVTRAT